MIYFLLGVVVGAVFGIAAGIAVLADSLYSLIFGGEK